MKARVEGGSTLLAVDPASDGAEIPRDELEAILEIVARAKGLDLRDYRRSTLARRIASRMEATRLPDAARYAEHVERDRDELERLVASLLIHVTSFFRDPPVFDALERLVAPRLLADRPGETLRTWVIGAATGEEAYSVAMSLEKACAATGSSYDVLATDRDGPSLEVARDGRYPTEALGAVPPELRARFFREAGGFLPVAPIKDRVRFAEHDFMGARLAPRQAVIADYGLVLCRNVLIYLDARYQTAAFERLATVVRRGGALVLGHAESVPLALLDRFEPFPGTDPTLRIFRRKPGPAPAGSAG